MPPCPRPGQLLGRRGTDPRRPPPESPPDSSRGPRGQKFFAVRGGRVLEQLPDSGALTRMLGRIQPSAQQLKAQINQIGIEDVRFAIIANALQPALQIYLPDLRAVYAELSGQAEQARDILQTRPPPPLESRQNVHQVHVPPVKSAQVIAVAKTRVAIAGFPVARGRYPVQEAAIVQHRQIETRAVPRHQIRSVFIHAVEESLDQILFRGALVAEAP